MEYVMINACRHYMTLRNTDELKWQLRDYKWKQDTWEESGDKDWTKYPKLPQLIQDEINRLEGIGD